ncbi:BamA/TamA family outer membrane protein [Reichenbachiella agarivorans]|uniref:BamA/TamA family outer membrane protein n=1 Tax=Reichenbachiella agarivorans TaxID=2979464 RepID=A0ABY6CSX2_9BACT|nr:BamA/TamA family outer membrane protein [Reichenbachiella agarivorans]UXP32558.1 BamA/TamA family outer membrane protein [Reichenbachiella agarivorans]
MRNSLFTIALLFLALVSKGQESDSAKNTTKKFAIYPALAYSPESKLNIGAIAFIVLDRPTSQSGYYRPTSITPYLVFTTNKQILFKSEFDFYTKRGINIGLISRLYKYPDSYYGIGNDTSPDSTERYDNNYLQLEGRVLKPHNANLFYGLVYDIQFNDIMPIEGGMLDADDPNGVHGGRNIGIGPAASYDSRNSTLYPTEGKYITASINLYSKAIGSQFNYVKYSFDFRHYFELLGPKNILAYQFKADLSSGTDIPFYKLNFMGGDNRLRGFDHQNLYRDRQSMYFQVEARQELFWRFGGVIFAGVGEVFDTFSNFNTDNVRFVYGLGGRFQAIKDKKLNIRADLGFSDNGQYGVYLSVREAF